MIQPDARGVVAAAPKEPARMGRGVSWLARLAAVVAVAVMGTSFVRLPYDTVAPGDATSVGPLVKIDGYPSYAAKGEVLSTTVSVRTEANPYQVLQGWIDPAVDVLERRQFRGDIPITTFEQLNSEAMADSKTAAKVVALRRLGFDNLGVGAEIVAVDRGFPGAAGLKPGDVVIAVDDRAVNDSDSMVSAIKAKKAGDAVVIGIADGADPSTGSRRTVAATLGAAPDGSGRLGVQLTTKVDFPFKISIDSGTVTGPSAGLAYGLELLDLLTPGELTGGALVAATGDLTIDGKVGSVGGVRQKTLGVQRAGATVFVVPKGNETEARAAAGPGLTVYAVDNFDEAVRRLGSLRGSNAVALGPAAGPGVK